MHTSKLFALVVALSSLSTAALGCDADATHDPQQNVDSPEDDDADESDDGDDGDGGGPAPLGLASAPQAQRGPGLHPCGNGILDAGEQCDEGLANGDDRECTFACTLNDCDLDQHGVCEPPHWPAADVGLVPCAEVGDDHERCALGLSGF